MTVAVAIQNDVALSTALKALASDLRAFVTELQRPRPRDGTWVATVRESCAELWATAQDLLENVQQTGQELRQALTDLSAQLDTYRAELAQRPTAARLRAMRKTLSADYQELVRTLRALKGWGQQEWAELRDIKPQNYARNLFHAAMGLTGLVLYETVLSRSAALVIMGVLASVFVTLEVTRRLDPRWNAFLVDKVFGPIARPRERYGTNSATYYLFALLAITFLFPQQPVCIAAGVLALADPMASIVGHRYGRLKLYRDKSVAGCAAFVLTAFVVTLVVVSVFGPTLELSRLLTLSLAVAGAGAIAELGSSRVDDNLSIPIACALVASFWF